MRTLAQELQGHYDRLLLHVEFKTKKRSLGEIDIVGMRGEQFDLFEVKCSYRIVKARKQLVRFHRLLRYQSDALFFYHGGSKSLYRIDTQLPLYIRGKPIRWTIEGLVSNGLIEYKQEIAGCPTSVENIVM